MKIIGKIVILVFCITTMLTTISFGGLTDPTQDPNFYKADDLTAAETTKLTERTGKILGMIRNVGVAVGVIALSIIGLRYMFGSIEEKAEYKETMMPFVIGAILLMAGVTVVDYIYSVAVKF